MDVRIFKAKGRKHAQFDELLYQLHLSLILQINQCLLILLSQDCVDSFFLEFDITWVPLSKSDELRGVKGHVIVEERFIDGEHPS